MSTDARIAREWAEKISVREKITFGVDGETLAAARHILATTTPPTMADVEWDDEVHAGLCAEHCDGYEVLMLGKELGDDDRIYCRWTVHGEIFFGPICKLHLTPIPGTKIDLTPRRTHADTVTAASIEDYKAGRVVDFNDKTLLPRPEDVPCDEAPESTPSHPKVLTIEADYRNAPAGTVVATEGEEAWTKGKDGSWETYGIVSGYNNYAMADEARQVLRWGWKA